MKFSFLLISFSYRIRLSSVWKSFDWKHSIEVEKLGIRLLFRPEGHVTMPNFLPSLWNHGKQPRTFNSDISPQYQVDSDN